MPEEVWRAKSQCKLLIRQLPVCTCDRCTTQVLNIREKTPSRKGEVKSAAPHLSSAHGTSISRGYAYLRPSCPQTTPFTRCLRQQIWRPARYTVYSISPLERQQANMVNLCLGASLSRPLGSGGGLVEPTRRPALLSFYAPILWPPNYARANQISTLAPISERLHIIEYAALNSCLKLAS